MSAASILYGLLLVMEALLAWALTGQAFLLATGMAGVVLYTALRHGSRTVAESVRLVTAGLLAVAAPFQYQTGLEALLLCFMALPHFLASTQALAEQSGSIPRRENPAMRAMVFTVAFYTSMALVLLLIRGMEPTLPGALTNALAVVVLLLGLPAWELSRIPRLKPSLPGQSPFSPRNWWSSAALLALVVMAFSLPLPMAADFLCRLSPRWSMDPVEFKNKPPKPPPTGTGAKPEEGGSGSRPGGEESSVTGEHTLPQTSNLDLSDLPRFFIQPDPASLTPELLQAGPAYLRTHTLNRFRDNKWSAEVSAGVWIADAADGTTDGAVTLSATPPPVRQIPHVVYASEADGYTLPALAGLVRIHLPRVYSIPGDVLQSDAAGDIQYRAVSAPVHYAQLPNRTLLEVGKLEDKTPLSAAPSDLGNQLERLASSIFPPDPILSDQIDALRAFFNQHYAYSTVMKNPNQLGALENFLFDERKGHCDFYASAATLLLRQAGVPSRIAYGFASDEADPNTGLITVRDRHAHAWTEIFLKGYGWAICDFTPPANIGSADDPVPPPATEDEAGPDLSTFSDAAAQNRPTVTTASPDAPAFSFGEISTWFLQQPWLGATLKILPWVLTGVALVVVAARLLRKKPEDTAAAQAAKAQADYEQQPGYFREFLRLSAAAGFPRPDSRTPLEHFRALQEAGLPVPPLRPLIDYHCAVRYEDLPRDERQEQNFMESLAAFGRALTSQQPAPAA